LACYVLYIHAYINQRLRIQIDPSSYLTTLEEAEIELIPGKRSDTRIKPLPLTSGHSRYITAVSLYPFVTVPLLGRYVTAVSFLKPPF
jgi:hypothetical protein